MSNFNINDLEFIGRDGYHYKIIDNKIILIEHKVLKDDYYKIYDELSKLIRNNEYPRTIDPEEKKNIKNIKIEIIEDDDFYKKNRYSCCCLQNIFI